jgi:hypothetical protein
MERGGRKWARDQLLAPGHTTHNTWPTTTASASLLAWVIDTLISSDRDRENESFSKRICINVSCMCMDEFKVSSCTLRAT